jgi:hypothetical protein
MSDSRFIRPLNKNVKPKARLALVLLAEECAETIQAVTKYLRHGAKNYNPFYPLRVTNESQLATELGDVEEAIARVDKILGTGARRKRTNVENVRRLAEGMQKERAASPQTKRFARVIIETLDEGCE